MITPKANSVTHICTLITGDRFYCCSDEKKEVWELRFHTMVKVNGQLKKFSQCRKDDGTTHRFDANRMIVFLRRTREVYKPRKDYSIDKFFP
jgi:hypothetical protein